MSSTNGKGRGSTRHMISVNVRGSLIGADHEKLGEEMARLVTPQVKGYDQFVADALARIRARLGIEWVDTHAWQDAQPHA